MGCCLCRPRAPPAGQQQQGTPAQIGERRRCRDVVFLLLFILFWVGMFIICGIAFRRGNLAYLDHAVDKAGWLCGGNHSAAGGPDLSAQPLLHWLDPFDLVENVAGIPYAKSVCVAACPQAACGLSGLPCQANAQYQCPYYTYAEDGVGGTLPGVLPYSTAYFAALNTTSQATCTATTSGVPSEYAKYQGAFIPAGATGAQECGGFFQLTSQFPQQGPCYAVWAPTYGFLGRCYPVLPSDVLNATLGGLEQRVSAAYSGVSGWLSTAGAHLERYIADIPKAKWLIVGAGLGGGLALSVLLLLLLRLFVGVFVWAALIGANALFAACALWAFSKAGYLAAAGKVGAEIAAVLPAALDPTASDRTVWKVIAIVLAACFGVLLIFSLLLIRRLRIAVACLKVTAQALGAMPSMMLFPLVPFVLEVALVFYWVFVAAMIYSSGTIAETYNSSPSSYNALALAQALNMTSATATAPPPPPPPPTPAANASALSQTACAEDPNCKFNLTWDRPLLYMFVYHFFGLLWAHQFLKGFGYVTIAGTVANYYWLGGSRTRQPCCSVCRAMCRTLRYHLGSIAIGSLIVAVVQFVRWAVAFVQYRLRGLATKVAAIKYVLCVVQCVLAAVECVLKFINRNAYILVAAKGYGYCRAASRAVALIVSNALRLAAVSVVGGAVIWLAKVAVCAGAGAIAFGLTEYKAYSDYADYPDTALSSPLLPVLLSALIAYFVADLFFGLYEYTVSTLLLCFCEDCESHNGVPQYAPPLLLHAVGAPDPKEDPKGPAAAAASSSAPSAPPIPVQAYAGVPPPRGATVAPAGGPYPPPAYPGGQPLRGGWFSRKKAGPTGAMSR